MKKLMLFIFLSLFSISATAQSVVKYPVYERVYERPIQYCHEVYTEPQYNAGGAVAGAVLGYLIGREIDRTNRVHYIGPVPGRHNPYRHYHYNSHVGRYAGTVAGAAIGSQMGVPSTTRVCGSANNGYYREVLKGYRVVTRFPNGVIREHFEPVYLP